MTTADLELTLAIIRSIVGTESKPGERKILRSEMDGLTRRIRSELAQRIRETGTDSHHKDDAT